MKYGFWSVTLSIWLALAVHVGGAFLVKGWGILGGRPGGDAAGCGAAAPAQYPIRVAIGTAQRAPASGPGPKAVLDPAAIRRPPALGSEWPDADERLRTAQRVFLPPTAEGTEPMRSDAPAGTRERVPDAGSRGRGPSWVDAEFSENVSTVRALAATTKLPARFLAAPSLGEAAAGGRDALRPDGAVAAAGLSLPVERVTIAEAPAWPEPDRALGVPEVFVDVLRPTPVGPSPRAGAASPAFAVPGAASAVGPDR